MQHNIRTALVALLLALTLLASPLDALADQTATLSSLQEAYDALEKQYKQLETELSWAQAARAALQQQLDNSLYLLQSAQGLLTQKDAQIAQLEAQLQPTPAPTATPRITPIPMLSTQAPRAANPLTIDTAYIGNAALANYQRENEYHAPLPDNYTYFEIGVLAFRGDNFRRNAAFGTVEVEEEKLSVLWQTPLGSLRTADSGTLYGVGWTGQPAIVKWPYETRMSMNLYEDKKNTSALREVIFAAQDGKVYFLDLVDGAPTRDTINVGYPLKGSVAVNPVGFPMIGFGQGISKLSNKTGDIGFYLYNLLDSTQLLFINGRSSSTQKQYGSNGAFDGSALFLWPNDAMIVAGENGLLYTVDLNTVFQYPSTAYPFATARLDIYPLITYLRSKAGAADDSQVSIESSVAMYDHYAYVADLYGQVRCVDVNTLTTVWAVDTGDNTDAAIALDFATDGSIALYTGNTAFARLGNKKDVTIRRLDAMTGEEAWSYHIKCDYDKSEFSGCKASPVVGENSISDLVIFTVNKVTGGYSSVIALNKDTGKVMWRTDLSAYAISSPVAVYNEADSAWIIQGDQAGVLYLMNARTGEIISNLALGGEIQGSPAVYRDILVIGTCSAENAFMYGIQIQ